MISVLRWRTYLQDFHVLDLPDIGPLFRTGTCGAIAKNTHINKRHSSSSASCDRSKFLKLLFKRETMLGLIFFLAPKLQ